MWKVINKTEGSLASNLQRDERASAWRHTFLLQSWLLNCVTVRLPRVSSSLHETRMYSFLLHSFFSFFQVGIEWVLYVWRIRVRNVANEHSIVFFVLIENNGKVVSCLYHSTWISIARFPIVRNENISRRFAGRKTRLYISAPAPASFRQQQIDLGRHDFAASTFVSTRKQITHKIIHEPFDTYNVSGW